MDAWKEWESLLGASGLIVLPFTLMDLRKKSNFEGGSLGLVGLRCSWDIQGELSSEVS